MGVSHEKAGLEMQMRWAQSHERKLRCRFAVAPKLAQLRAGAIPEAGAQPLDFARLKMPI